MVSDGVAQVFSELLNAEVEAAGLGQQGDADFTESSAATSGVGGV